jgi:hypothetical protein
MYFVFVFLTILNYMGGGCRRKMMLGIIRIVFMLSVPFFAFSQINTSIINATDAKIKILSVTENVLSEDNYTKPDTGKKFISVKVLFNYFGCTSKIYPSFFDMKMKDLDGNFFEPSIKSFVVIKPYLNITNIKAEKKISGWVTFEVPKKIAINSLQIKYENLNQVCSDWIPLWPVASNGELTQKIAKQVSREKNYSCIKAEQLILKKTLLSIYNYLNYIETNQHTHFVKGLENASHAKLLIHSFNNNRLNFKYKKCPALNDIITLLSQDLPENIVKGQSAKDKQNIRVNLMRLKKSVIKNYIQN